MNKNLITALILAVGGFGIFALVWPQYRELRAVQEAIAAGEIVVTQREKQLAGFKLADEAYKAKSHQAQISRLLVFLPEKEQIDQIITAVQAISSQTGLQLDSIEVGEADEIVGATYKKISVGLELKGSYLALTDFLKAIEDSLRLYDIYEISANRDATGTSSQLTLSIKMYTYSLK